MQYRLEKKSELGRTGLHIPPVIFGTSALGNLYKAIDNKTKLNIISECIKYISPPVVFDIAGKYGAGLALEELGRCLMELDVPPGEVIISNKLGWFRTPLTSPEPVFEPGVWKELTNDAVQKISYAGILECYEQGNKLLGDEYIPGLVSVHDPDEFIREGKTTDEKKERLDMICDAYRALNDLKKGGKVKAVGVGAKDWRTIQLITDNIDLDWVMLANSLTIMHHPPELLKFCSELDRKGTGIINSAVFQSGFLTGGDYFDYVKINPDTPENKSLFEWRSRFFALCEKYNILPATACVNFALSIPGVVSISLNTSNPQRVRQNVESVTADVPGKFYMEMKEQGLISRDYPRC